MNTDSKKTETEQCTIPNVSKSLKNKKRKLMYMGRDKWNNEVWKLH
jgi:hypothetical protein